MPRELSGKGYDNCTITSEEETRFNVTRSIVIILFSLLALLWLFNVVILLAWSRMPKRLVTWLLYGIIGLITFARLYEVIQLQVYQSKEDIVVSGIIATYGKIALGCCQLAAMFQIRN